MIIIRNNGMLSLLDARFAVECRAVRSQVQLFSEAYLGF